MNFRTAGILLLSLGGFLYTLERVVAYFFLYLHYKYWQRGYLC